MFAVSIIGFGIVSCRKHTVKKDDQSKSISRYLREGDFMPTVENGMLVFVDEDQLDAYIQYVDSTIVSRPETYDTLANPADTLGVEARLDDWETQFSYASLRKKINQNFDALNEIGWEDVSQIPEDFYLHGSTVRSIYNADGDVKVGTTIQHLFNANYDIMITDGDLTTLQRAHNLTLVDESELTNIFALDTNVIIFDRSVCIPVKLLHQELWKTTADTTWQANFGIGFAGGTNCNKTRTYRLSSISLVNTTVAPTTYYHSGDKLDIYVDWGDGTIASYTNQPIYLNPTSSGSGSGSTVTIDWPNTPGMTNTIPNHNYPAAGNYTVTVKVKRPYQGSYVASATKTFSLPISGCDNHTKRTSTYWKYTPDGAQAFSGQIIVDQNFWGHTYFEAESKGYHKKNGRYKHKKVERLVAQIWFNRYGGATSNPCDNFLASEATGQWPYHDKTVDAKKSGYVLGQDYWQTITSDHKLLYYGVYYDLTLTLNACD